MKMNELMNEETNEQMKGLKCYKLDCFSLFWLIVESVTKLNGL